MKQHDFIDLGKLMDDIFAAAEDFTSVFSDSMSWGSTRRDFYPSYAYPPTNVYITEDKTLVFEFALAGFSEDDINLEFRGEHMYFSADLPSDFSTPENAKFFKQRLKMKPVEGQKYYVPSDKFDRDNVSAVFTNGILRVTIPPKAEPETQEATRIKIVKQAGSGSSKKASTSTGKAQAQPS